jgi:CRP-like cAMP-binding protein
MYPFFGFLSGEDISKVAMVTDEISWKEGDQIIGIKEEAKYIYFLERGDINLHYKVVDELVSDKSKEFFVGDISPGEPFGLSALIEPYEYTATAIAAEDSKGIVVDAKKLLAITEEDKRLGFALMQKVAKAIFERLGQVRVELVAARS